MRRLIWISTVCKCMSEFTRCPKYHNLTLSVKMYLIHLYTGLRTVSCFISSYVSVIKVKISASYFCSYSLDQYKRTEGRVKSGKVGHLVNSDTPLQTVEILMRRILMSRLIRIFTVCLVNLFLFQ